MKNLLSFILIGTIALRSTGQVNYCDFEGTKHFYFGMSTGMVDSMFLNPAPNVVDSSAHCAKYIRDTALYDYIKLYTNEKLIDVTPYANNASNTPKIKMKLYSAAPVGTIVQLQLGIKSVDNYPAGVHSEYISATTTQNAWQNITFNYFQSPTGSLALPTDINKIIILFRPNSTTRDTIYFDDLMGPELLSMSADIDEPGITAGNSITLYQNIPNPAKEYTNISFESNSSGTVSLEIYDLLGKSVYSYYEEKMNIGKHNITVETENIPNGIYFYVLKQEGILQSKRMIIAK